MSVKYDNPCRQCADGTVERNGESELCDNCDGYGHLMTFEGFALIEFLRRRGIATPMSPREEESLSNVLGD